MGVSDMDEKNRVDAVNLFTFLKEYARLSHKPERSLNSDRYREVFWLGNVPREPECASVLWKGESGEDGKRLSVPSDGWLEIRRPERSDPPETPEEAALWVNIDSWEDSKQERPELCSKIPNPDWGSGIDDEEKKKIPKFLNLSDFTEIKTVWDKYIEEEWRAWAEKDRKKEKVQDCYNRLFRLHRAKLQMGDQYELILSVGCLNWVDPNANHEQVKRHVLTLASTIIFDSINAMVTVRADGSMSDVRLETDMLQLHQQPDEVTDQLLKDKKLDLGTDILSDKAKELLKIMAHGLPSGNGSFGKFIDILDEVSVSATNKPVISFSPALILRRRSSRTLIEVFEKIEKDLGDEANEVPPTVRAVAGELGVENRFDSHKKETEKKEWAYEESEEIFFPLKSNDEQKQIIGRMEKQTGVLVQGPPGTGKSQTISNLICHLLAKGQRILITSQKTSALRVLQKKLPPSVADLCVLLLGEGHDQQIALQKSVSEITNRYTLFNESNHYCPK